METLNSTCTNSRCCRDHCMYFTMKCFQNTRSYQNSHVREWICSGWGLSGGPGDLVLLLTSLHGLWEGFIKLDLKALDLWGWWRGWEAGDGRMGQGQFQFKVDSLGAQSVMWSFPQTGDFIWGWASGPKVLRLATCVFWTNHIRIWCFHTAVTIWQLQFSILLF